MPLMLMSRNWTIASSLGHTFIFEKDTPIFVPNDPRLVELCLGAGATYVDTPPPLPDQAVKAAPEIPSRSVMQEKCVALFKEMSANPEEHRQNFTAFGRPNAKFVASKLGFDVSAKEVEEFWNAFRKVQ